MKKIVFIFIIIITQIGYTQITDESFNPEAEANRLAKTPNSPEAQAFTKYGNTPVNMYTGAPNIQIPIYTHKGRELDLPISLTYDASGIKVDQLATQVGLGWNLNVGGRISRIVNGFPDDFYSGAHTNIPYKSILNYEVKNDINSYKNTSSNPIFDNKNELLNYMRFLKRVNDNEYDTQPDYFSFNALGKNDTFVIDVQTGLPKPLNNPRLKVSFTHAYGASSPITKWTVKTDDGTIYIFEAEEITRDVNLSIDNGPQSLFGSKKEYNSSWLLTKIESPNKKDIYEFTYTDLGFSSNNRTAATFVGVTNALTCGPNNTPTPTNSMGYSGGSVYKIKQKVLNKITHNGKRIIAVNLMNRLDLDVNSAIQKINIYKKDSNNHASDLLTTFEFTYDYFKTSGFNTSTATTGAKLLNLRLKLDQLIIKDSNSVILNKHQFEYNDPYNLTSTTSKSQDYYGYFNGKTNSVLYPKSEVYTCSPTDGADRTPNFSFAQRGVLNKIIYPTGGYTEFEYEPHKEAVSNTTSSWQTVTTAALAYPSLPLYNSSVCNASVFNNSVTSAVTSQVFQVTGYQGNYKFIYNQSGNLGKFYNIEHIATLVKISSPTATLSWADVYDSNCNVKTGVDVVWEKSIANNGMTPVYPYDYTMTLSTGYYQMILANPSSSLSNSFVVQKSQSTVSYIFNEKAGFRVKSIKDFDHTNALAIHKEYEYPSGTVISNPRYIYRSAQYSVGNESVVSPTDILHRLSYASGTEKPHIGYKKVIEKIIKNGLSSAGKTLYKFYTNHYGNYKTGAYKYYIQGKETANHYGVDYKLGKPLGNAIFDSDAKKITSTSNFYEDLEYYSNIGIYIMKDESKNLLYPIPKKDILTNKWFITFAPAIILPVTTAAVSSNGYVVSSGSWSGNLATTIPSECNIANFNTTQNINDLCNPAIARLTKQNTYAWGKVGNIIQKNSNQYFDNGNKIISQSTSYKYYNYLLKETSTINSNEEVLKKEFLYADQITDATSGSLKSNNILSVPLETKVYMDDVLMSYKKTHFSGTFPSKIQTAKGSGSLKDRVEYERFEDGNLVQVKQTAGSSTAYIWGYDKRYIVAKVENTNYAAIEALSAFGSGAGFTITEGLSAAQEIALRGMSNALVSTYAYDPMIGVISMTDPRGETIYYQYDSFNRLEFVKDAEGNILSKNEYNYKN